MPFLGVFGHVNIDYIISLPKFPELNTSIKLTDSKRYFGGTGANIARTASKLGVPVALSSFVGENFPEDYYLALKKDGISLNDLVTVKNYLTPTCWIMSDREQNQVAIVDQGPMEHTGKFPIRKYTVNNSKILHITTGNPDYYIKIIDYAKKLNKIIAFDPAQEIHYIYNPKKFKYILQKSKYFFANENECKTALRYLGLKNAEDLLNFVEIFILTRGKNGSVIYTKEKDIKIPIIKSKKIIDPTGAGDAYRAGFYAGLYRGKNLRECGIIGACVSSFVLESKGPQLNNISWKKVIERLDISL